MKNLLMVCCLVLSASVATADFDSSSDELSLILSSLRANAALKNAGDLWTARRIQAGEHTGYRIVTSQGCQLEILVVKGQVVVRSKSCQK